MPKKEATPTKKNKGGRPKWTPTEEDIKRVETYAARGFSKDLMGDLFGKNRDTIFERKKDTPEFSDAIKRGEASLIGRILDAYGKKIDDGDVACILFGLKTRCGWKETKIIETTGKDGGPIQHDINVNESEDETRRRIREIMDEEH